MIEIALAALLLTANPAQAQAPSSKPVYAHAPGHTQPAALKMQPILAKALDIPPPAAAGISVRLQCVAQVTGTVGGCRVLNETRPGLGFGAAAVALMNGSPADPAWRNDRTGDATFEHTIEFTP